jgi:hypothetical protein
MPCSYTWALAERGISTFLTILPLIHIFGKIKNERMEKEMYKMLIPLNLI